MNDLNARFADHRARMDRARAAHARTARWLMAGILIFFLTATAIALLIVVGLARLVLGVQP